MQREMLRRRMLAAVPKATVVITNPTHFAVALEYTATRWPRRGCVAKGADCMARAHPDDRARARRADRREHAAGAGALRAAPKSASRFPATLFDAVAEVLAYLDSRSSSWCCEVDGARMPSPTTVGARRSCSRPARVIAVVALMIVPLPPLLLDLLLSVDIGLSVVLLLTAIYVKQPVEFSVFPSLLLLLTLLRLSLNVAVARG